MALSCVLLLIGLASVYSEPIMLKTLSMNKEMMPEKMLDDPVMVETAMAKPKRDSWHHSTPCPPYLDPHHAHKGWQPHPQVQFIHQPTIIQKPGWNSGWNNPGWNQGWSKPAWNPGWSKPEWNPGWNSGWSKPGWNQGWSKPSHGWQQPSHGWQQPIVITKPSHGWPSSYAPQWQSPHLIKPAVVVKPDCPPWQHEHPHQTGIVYAPQHQSYHEPHIKYLHNEPQYVKVIKPAYHHPVIPWQPPVHHHLPKVELCD